MVQWYTEKRVNRDVTKALCKRRPAVTQLLPPWIAPVPTKHHPRHRENDDHDVHCGCGHFSWLVSAGGPSHDLSPPLQLYNSPLHATKKMYDPLYAPKKYDPLNAPDIQPTP